MGRYLIGCDVGTTGAKAVLSDTDGIIYGSYYVEYPLHSPMPNWYEHNPNDYWDVFVKNMRHILSESGIDPADVAGISVSACGPNCVLVDREGNALKSAPIWMDRRGVEECEQVRNIYTDDEIFSVSGNSLDPHNGTIKLLWEKNHNPDIYDKTYKMLSPANFISMKLTGTFYCDYSNASLVSVVFDIVKRQWKYDMIEAIGLDPDKFPQLAPCSQVIGTVTDKAAQETGLAKGTPVVAGTIDCNASWLGNGTTQPGDACLSMGTAGALGVVHSEARFSRNLETIVHVADSENLYTTLAATSTCGGLLRYMRDTFTRAETEKATAEGKDIYDILTAEAEQIRPGADGLIILPYLSGERTPLWNPKARGVVFGLSFSHTRGHWVRALMESGIYAVYHCLKIMQDNQIKILDPISISEGGAKSPLWRQITSDILGKEMGYMKSAKGAPMGNVINAGVGVGLFKDYSAAKRFIKIDEVSKPDPNNHALYEEYFAVYRRLYEQVKDEYENVAQILDRQISG